MADETFTVTQLGFTCVYKLSPTNRTHGNGSVTGLVSVTTSNGCTWSVVNTNDWVTITAGESGDGNGGVGYLVEPNLLSTDRTALSRLPARFISSLNAALLALLRFRPPTGIMATALPPERYRSQ